MLYIGKQQVAPTIHQRNNFNWHYVSTKSQWLCFMAIWMPNGLGIRIRNVLLQVTIFYLFRLWCPKRVKNKLQWPCLVQNPNIWHCPKLLLRPFGCENYYKTLVFINLTLHQLLLTTKVQCLWLQIPNFTITINTLTRNITSFKSSSKLNTSASNMFLHWIWQLIFLSKVYLKLNITIVCYT
jgi:hypothetical protein